MSESRFTVLAKSSGYTKFYNITASVEEFIFTKKIHEIEKIDLIINTFPSILLEKTSIDLFIFYEIEQMFYYFLNCRFRDSQQDSKEDKEYPYKLTLFPLESRFYLSNTGFENIFCLYCKNEHKTESVFPNVLMEDIDLCTKCILKSHLFTDIEFSKMNALYRLKS